MKAENGTRKESYPCKQKYYDPMWQTYCVLENDFALTAKIFQMSTLKFSSKDQDEIYMQQYS